MPAPKNCPRCGKPLNENETVCSNCGLNFYAPAQKQGENPYTIISVPEPSSLQEFRHLLSKMNFRLICFGILAVAVVVLAFLSANRISGGAAKILQIRTTDGRTVNEVYYREMGNIYNGLAIFIRACGIFFAGTLVKFGLKEKT